MPLQYILLRSSWLLLLTWRSSSDPNSATIPKRGEKDFEPNPTQLQSEILAASRQAMHNALSFTRLHNEKNVVRGVFCPDGVLIPREKVEEEKTKIEKDAISTDSSNTEAAAATTITTTIEAEAMSEELKEGKVVIKKKSKPAPTYTGPPGTCVCVPTPRGQFFKNMGKADTINRVWLLPEEALYLIERGSLDIRFAAKDPVTITVTSAEGAVRHITGSVEEEDGGIPMSLQAAYAMMLGRSGLSMERYTVYSGLRRGGYTVVRAGGWFNEDDQSDFDGIKEQEKLNLERLEQRRIEKETQEAQNRTLGEKMRWMFSRIAGSITALGRAKSTTTSLNKTCWTARGPVIGLGLYRDYPSIFRALTMIPTPTINKPTPSSLTDLPPLVTPYTIHFHVFKPSTTYRKSCPPPPDFRLCVVNTRQQTSIPSLAALDGLFARTPFDPPQGEKMERMMYMRLRHGQRNVILAIVDQGVTSFLRLADAGFGGEKLYESRVIGGHQKHGGRGFRGRGGGGRGGRGGRR